jgi:spore maturation protein CgeB
MRLFLVSKKIVTDMKIVYSALKYDAMDSQRGLSFEHENLYDTLAHMEGVEVVYVPYDRIREVGRASMNRELLETVKKERPDLFLAIMYTNELEYETLDKIREYTTSCAWMCDDHWRFDDYSRYYAPHFSYVATTYSKVLEKYRAIGYTNVLHTQWAANVRKYYSSNVKDIDVSFIGSWNKERGRILRALWSEGVSVEVRGGRWNAGRVGQEEMLNIMSRSKIGLGLNPSSAYFGMRPLARLFFRRSGSVIVPDFWNFFSNIHAWQQKKIPQIKARMFEIPASGALLMTQHADNLEDYYIIGKEVVTYKDTPDLIEKVRYYLAHSEEANNIARAGHERTLVEHTYEKRFKVYFYE